MLVDYLRTWYDDEHAVTLYEASPYPFAEPLIDRLTLGGLVDVQPRPLATLYVPPATERPPDAEMAARLGITS